MYRLANFSKIWYILYTKINYAYCQSFVAIILGQTYPLSHAS